LVFICYIISSAWRIFATGRSVSSYYLAVFLVYWLLCANELVKFYATLGECKPCKTRWSTRDDSLFASGANFPI